ncbi:hypothetical protein [Bacillus cereus group sp. BfR-BA-01380]|uniref:hypothetical protein n=1 Tax=Bacillus cereus group sp. BfR-BA-01380 TaxID=2920324 RepID=UPI001F5A36F7|nr:hypothetical protein [Bacillus cereus group sp. BfR-BA-01380]
MKIIIGIFSVLLTCLLTISACSTEKKTSEQSKTSANTSKTEKEQPELKLVAKTKKEIEEFWKAIKDVDAPKLNEPTKVWEEYYAKLGLSSRISSQINPSSQETLSYFEGKNEQEQRYVASVNISPHSTTPEDNTILRLQEGIAIAKNFLPKGYTQKEETFSILYQDSPSLLTYQVEYVANGSVPKGAESLYLVICYNNLGVSSASIGREKKGYNQPEMEGKYAYLKPDLIKDEAALKNLIEVQSKQDIKPEYIVQ